MIEVEKIKMRVKYEISEIGEVIGGATPSTKDEDNYGGDISWITPKDLSSFTERYIYRGERNISEKGLHSCSAKLMPKDTVLFSSRAPIGYVAIAANKLCTNQGFKSIIADESKIHYLYLYYYLIYKKSEIEAVASGTTFKEVSGSVLKKFKIEIHESILEQKAIAATLSCLDDMIELNNRTNKVLEEMVQAIFKHWFVDFEFPNENGEPYKSSGGEMEDSELGEIPLGWRIRQFTDIIEVTGGGTPKTSNHDYWDGEIPFFTPKDCNLNYYVLDTEKHITELGLENCNSKLYPTNTVFITARGTVGKIAIAGRPMAINQSCYALRYRGEPLQYYVHQITKNAVNELQHKASGAVFDAIVTRDFDSLKTIVPTTDLVRAYDSTISKTYELLRINNMQNVVLSLTRDTLLPKLMSGEIRVPIEEVG
jgi:type I restriction enzyme S subunit